MDGVWDSLYHDLQQRLGRLDLHTEIYHPYADDEPVTGSVAESMADVYVDLKAGLVLYDTGHMGDAVGEWRTNFEIHWGHHALDVLRALYAHEFMSDELDDIEIATPEQADGPPARP